MEQSNIRGRLLNNHLYLVIYSLCAMDMKINGM